MSRRPLLPVALLTATVLAGCGGSGATKRQPVVGHRGNEAKAAQGLGFPGFATKNTTRVGGADAVADAAAVALAVYPARERSSHPLAVTLVDRRNWTAAISAAQLMASPLRAPVLLSEGGSLPAASADALRALAPLGAGPLGGAQVVRVGNVARPPLRAVGLAPGSPAALAAAIDRLHTSAAAKPSPAVVVASQDAPGFAMPAAGWAAKSGDPVLWVTRDAVPPETRQAIIAHQRPHIYVLGPESAVSKAVLDQLSNLGAVRRIAGADPVRNAIAFARFSDGSFGWNVVDPGHGLAVGSARRPLDAAAAAPLSGAGQYGPLVLTDQPTVLPQPLQDYLLDIQPGYEKDPVRGVYNRAWIIGDGSAVSLDVQARIDALLEIQPVKAAPTP